MLGAPSDMRQPLLTENAQDRRDDRPGAPPPREEPGSRAARRSRYNPNYRENRQATLTLCRAGRARRTRLDGPRAACRRPRGPEPEVAMRGTLHDGLGACEVDLGVEPF